MKYGTTTEPSYLLARYILDAIREKEDKGSKPLRLEASVIMDMMIRESFGALPVTYLYGLEYRVNPKLQGIALIVRDEEDI